MARQVLENGVILPAEYSDDWYDDMTSNLTKLDDVIGSDSEKLSSADVGAAALSNNYNDLDNLPTIPTVNDATLTIQKNGVDVQTFTANASSNVTANITVPTKTSDLTNDSNFVDTSNAAVSSGITSAKVSDYDTHIADTDIHVTTADKNRWNNQTYVFRYSSTALTASSTNSNALLDNTDNLKVGDKVIDSNGVLFSITAIDTANNTFTIGTALIDLAQDSDVVHKSGNETIAGEKTFNDLHIIGYGTQYKGSRNAYILPEFAAGYSGLSITTLGISQAVKIGNFVLDANNKPSLDTSKGYIQIATGENNGVNACVLEPRNSTSSSLGASANRWSKIYGTEYYYGSNNVEFSTKFVTTDTAQTIVGKEFISDMFFTSAGILDVSGGRIASIYRDTNKKEVARLTGGVQSSGRSLLEMTVRDIFNNEYQTCGFGLRFQSSSVYGLIPITDNTHIIGTNNVKLKSINTNQINNLEPSSLSLPNLSNGIDISSYIDVSQTSTNYYTPPANGWISITIITPVRSSIQIECGGGFRSSVYSSTDPDSTSDYISSIIIPCVKNDTATIYFRSSSGGTIKYAKFYPCQGNV